MGHSERRQGFHEDTTILRRKVVNAIEADLKVIYCVGEPIEQRNDGSYLDYIKHQILDIKDLLTNSTAIDIAYEPIWTIGTGRAAKFSQINEVIAHIKVLLCDLNCAGRILYGGSVSAENSEELMGIPHIGGFLVGNASLNQNFGKIAFNLSKSRNSHQV